MLIYNSIVFVHGLNGNSIKSWTSTGQKSPCWPKDFLPKRFPFARIMTFGYAANVVSDTSEGRIATFAENLLGALYGERSYRRVCSPQLPLLFGGSPRLSNLPGGHKTADLRLSQHGRDCRKASALSLAACHSIPFANFQALVVARARKIYKPIARATRSIVFMATPHRGSDAAYWGEIARKLSSFLRASRSSTDAVKELKAFSTVLKDISDDFVNIASSYNFVSFYEQKETNPFGIVSPHLPSLTRSILTLLRSSGNGLLPWVSHKSKVGLVFP